VYVHSPIAFHEMTHLVTLRAIWLVLVRFGQKAVALPCPVTTVSYDRVATPGGMLTGILCQSSTRTLRHSQMLTGRSTPYGSTPLWSIDPCVLFWTLFSFTAFLVLYKFLTWRPSIPTLLSRCRYPSDPTQCHSFCSVS